MVNYVIDKDRASYYEPLDILYLTYGDGSLSCCDAVEDTPSGVTVMYGEDGELDAAEIYDLFERISSLPATILIDAAVPFTLTINGAIGVPERFMSLV